MINRSLCKKVRLAAAFLVLSALPLMAMPSEPVKSVRNAVSNTKKSSAKVNSFETPDFAFPQTVEKNADAALRKALAEKNYVDALKGSIQVCVAGQLISHDKVNENIAMFSKLADELPAPYSSLALLLEAQTYNDVYMAQRWKFNNRSIPVSPAPADVMEWSRDIFSLKIRELVSKAVEAEDSARSMKLSEISPILTNEKDGIKYGMSVYDFIVMKGVGLLRNYSGADSETLIPFGTASGSRATERAASSDIFSLLDKDIVWNESHGNMALAAALAFERYRDLPYTRKKGALDKYISRFIDTPYCAPFIIESYSANNYGSLDLARKSLAQSNSETKAFYDKASSYLAKFPDCDNAESLRTMISNIENKRISFSGESRILPDRKGKISVTASNIYKFNIIVARIPDTYLNRPLTLSQLKTAGKTVASIPVSLEGNVPSSAMTDVELPALKSGLYAVVPSANGDLSGMIAGIQPKQNVDRLLVSRLSYITATAVSGNARNLYIVDGSNQRPVKGAKVTFKTYGRKNSVSTEMTDDKGTVTVPRGSHDVTVVSGKDLLNFDVWSWDEVSGKRNRDYSGTVYTDLSIYRPGDRMSFMGMLYSTFERESKIEPGQKVRMILRDANYQEKDTLDLTTDALGRVSGGFTLPKDGLLGGYSVSMMRGEENCGSAQFEVAEYKTPTFYVETSDLGQDVNLGDVVTVNGKVTTYSGMPVAGAKVSYKVVYQPLFWMNDPVNANYGGETVAGENGSFEFSLPTEGLRNTVFERGGYRIEITATSPTGETEEAPGVWFSMGKAYSVVPQLPARFIKNETKPDFAVRVLDMMGNPVNKKVYYRIAPWSDREENAAAVTPLYSGDFMSPKFSFDFGQLVSGRYSVTFSLDGEFKDDKEAMAAKTEITVYGMNDATPPYKTPIWVPQEEIVVAPDAKDVDVRFGSSYDDSWILAMIADCDKVIEYRWIKVGNGMTHLSLKAPEANNRMSVTFSGMRGLKGANATVTLVPAIQKESVEITTVSFRDRITPGAREKWTFGFSFNNAKLAGIPVAAVMSNKALNALNPFRWYYGAGGFGYGTQGFMSSDAVRDMWFTINLDKGIYKAMTLLSDPDWNLYGYSLYGNSGYRGRIMSKSRSLMTSGADNVIEEASVRNEMFMSADTAAPMALKEEKTGAPVAEKTEGTDAGEGGNNGKKETFRNVNVPLAFFMPALVTDGDGNAVADFTVPDFNGTWQFQIMGYTPEVRGAVKVLDVIASKPVMSQLNAPRFLRTGDRTVIKGVVFNNSKDAADLSARIELFDPATGKVLKSEVFDGETVAAGASRTVGLEYDVKDDMNVLGIRIYGSNSGFSDGEQTVIPVYPCSTPVIESKPFYLAPGENKFSINLPAYGKDSKVTLVYNDNPIWECVTALPDISEPKSSNVLSQVYSLYGNAIGAGLALGYPEILKAIREFADPSNSADSTLVSNLEKNADLKNVLLNNTPWVRSAASETMRMQSLVKYADPERSMSIISSNLAAISRLQNPDGGWSWCDGMKSSEFITSRVLLHLAMLEGMGYLPSSAKEMAIKGLAYSDAVWVKDLKDYRGSKFPYVSMLNYLYVRSFFKGIKTSADFSAMKTKGIAAVRDGWKNMSIYEKATAATLLSREGNTGTARLILESLRQYASVSKEKGMWFDNLSSAFSGWNRLITTAQVLEAFAEIVPEDKSIDLMRQWLVITKQTENWGDDRSTAEVIHALLTTGSKWTVPSSPARIYIGRDEIVPDRVARLTGCINAAVSPRSKGELRIERNGAGPAWGGVISQYVAPITDVKAEKIPQLSIVKNVYVVTDNSEGTEAGRGNLKVGDKVRVTLTLTCDRDIEYVAVTDERSACLEPADQISSYSVSDGVWMYKEVRDNSTNLFIPFLGKGTHVVSYECYVDRAGSYSLGIATAQSQYAPTITAHSGGSVLIVSQGE